MFRNILITFSSGAISGQLMSELATGMSSDLLNDMRQATGVPSTIPPDPLRSVGVTVRRLHDLDRSGWFFLLVTIPIVGWIILIYWACQPGTSGSNRFGDEPAGAAPIAAH